jgi:hypothetical protein
MIFDYGSLKVNVHSGGQLARRNRQWRRASYIWVEEAMPGGVDTLPWCPLGAQGLHECLATSRDEEAIHRMAVRAL